MLWQNLTSLLQNKERKKEGKKEGYFHFCAVQ